jgi:hypothetical protein
LSLIAAKEVEAEAKISRNDIENTSGELRNKINYSKARNRLISYFLRQAE